MPDRVIARRYAAALFGAAVKQDVVDRVDGDLESVKRLLDQDPALGRFMLSPEVLTEHKVDMLRRVLGDRVHQLVLNFLMLLIDKKRFDHLDEIAEAVDELTDEHHGLVRAQVATAVELGAGQEERLQERLSAITGKQVVLECMVDPALIGGVRVVMGDRLLDGSVRHALDQLREELAAVSVL